MICTSPAADFVRFVLTVGIGIVLGLVYINQVLPACLPACR